MEETFLELGQSVFGDVFVAQKHQLFLNLIFGEINVSHDISCKTEEAEIRQASINLDREKARIKVKVMAGMYLKGLATILVRIKP